MKMGASATGRAGILLALSVCTGWVASPPGHAQEKAFDLPSSEVIEPYLDSVTTVALTASEHEERIHAVIGVSSVGRLWAIYEGAGHSVPPYPQVVRRLRAIYEQTDDVRVRSYIVRWMDLQAEREESVAFLLQVARQDLREDRGAEWPLSVSALDALVRMGPKGRKALQQLSADGSVQHPLARVRLRRLEDRGWRPPP